MMSVVQVKLHPTPEQDKVLLRTMEYADYNAAKNLSRLGRQITPPHKRPVASELQGCC